MTDYIVAALAVSGLVGALVYVAFFLSPAQSARLASIFERHRWRVHSATIVGLPTARSLLVLDSMRGRGRGGREHARSRIVSLANGAVTTERIEHANVSSIEVGTTTDGETVTLAWTTREGATTAAADGRAFVWRDSESVLVRHDERPGQGARLRLSRVTSDGTVRWQIDVVGEPAWAASRDHLVSAFAVEDDIVLVVEEREGEKAVAHVVRIDGARGTRRFAARL